MNLGGREEIESARDRDREREGDRERGTETERERERDRDRERERGTEREGQRQREKISVLSRCDWVLGFRTKDTGVKGIVKCLQSWQPIENNHSGKVADFDLLLTPVNNFIYFSQQ